MLTISSIAVAPLPQQATPVVRAQPVTSAKPGNAVARDAAAPAQVTPQGDAARVQVAAAPPLAPVTPPQESQRAEGQTNAAVPERNGLPPATATEPGPRERAQAQAQAAQQERAERAREEDAARRAEERRALQRGDEQRRADAAGKAEEGYPVVKNPALEALDKQIEELLPNLWKASRKVVDMVIGEEALKAAAERAQKLEELHQRLNAQPLASLPPGEPQQTYGAAGGETDGRDVRAGRQIDRLV